SAMPSTFRPSRCRRVLSRPSPIATSPSPPSPRRLASGPRTTKLPPPKAKRNNPARPGEPVMLLIAGLGNPGAKYEDNRHNVGFMAADIIARRHSCARWSRKFQGLIAEGRIGSEKVLLIKPQTFMNESGRAVGEAMRFHKLTPA